MDCSQCQASLSAFIDNEATNPTVIARHLEGCPECKNLQAALAAPGELLRQALHPAPELIERIVEAIPMSNDQGAEQQAFEHQRAPFGFRMALAAALLLALGGTLWLLLESNNPEPQQAVPGQHPATTLEAVEITRAGQLVDAPGLPLLAGDQVSVKATVELPLPDGSSLALTPGSQIEMLKPQAIELRKGRVSWDSRGSSKTLVLETPAGKLRCRRGRCHAALVGQAPRQTLFVSVDTGDIELQSRDGRRHKVPSGGFLLANPQGVLPLSKQAAPQLETDSQLETAKSRIRALEAELAALRSAKKAGSSRSDPKNPKYDKKKWDKSPLKRPPGMTEEEQSSRVRTLVDTHSWRLTAQALRAGMKSKNGGRSLSMKEAVAMKAFDALMKQLFALGVGFSDARVARAFVPAWVSSLGVDLDEPQIAQLQAFLDSTPRPAAPRYNRPLAYAESKIVDLQWTLELEQQLQRMLDSSQLQKYLANVGDNPFESGLALKIKRVSCPATKTIERAAQVVEIWSKAFQTAPADRGLLRSRAQRLVSDVAELPTASASIAGFQRRRAILLRAVKILELQGEAEWDLLQSLAAGSEKSEKIMKRQCVVIEFGR
jgi:hypothetical protein